MKHIGQFAFKESGAINGHDTWPEGEAIEALWQELRDSPHGLIDPKDILKRLNQAVEDACRSNPTKFSAFILAHMVEITTSLLIRSHLHVVNAMSDHDARMDRNGPGVFPPEPYRETMSGVYELQRHLAEILQVQAHTARLNEIAREKKLKNERDEKRHQKEADTRCQCHGEPDFMQDPTSRKRRGRRS